MVTLLTELRTTPLCPSCPRLSHCSYYFKLLGQLSVVVVCLLCSRGGAQDQIIPLTRASCTAPVIVACHWQNANYTCSTNASSSFVVPPWSCDDPCATKSVVRGKCQDCYITTYTDCCSANMTMDAACQTQKTPAFYESGHTEQGCYCCP
jgi:hypothetical protein